MIRGCSWTRCVGEGLRLRAEDGRGRVRPCRAVRGLAVRCTFWFGLCDAVWGKLSFRKMTGIESVTSDRPLLEALADLRQRFVNARRSVAEDLSESVSVTDTNKAS